MRISEISTPELRQLEKETVPEHCNSILKQIESIIKQSEKSTSTTKSTSELSQLASDLRQTLSHLTQLAPLPDSLKLHLWKLSYRLWNACVDLANASSIISSSSSTSTATTAASEQAKLRHVAADMLLLAGEFTGVPSPGIKTAFFYYKTGTVYHSLKKYDLASNCFEKAAELVSKIDLRLITDTGERKLLLDLNLARSRTAWEVSDPILAITMLNRAKSLLFGSSNHYKTLANQYIAFGKNVLTMEREKSNGGFKEALKLMNDALELCEKGLSTARTRQETIDLKGLKSKTLRFIAAVHLQMEEFESVIKCVRVLREGEDGGERDNHPCLPVLSMKAWLGLGRFNDAEKELRGMVGNKGIPEGVWVSAVEEYFRGVGIAGVETAKGVFLGLLGRCHVSASSAIRIVHRVIEGGGEGARVRAKVVAELVSDERVVGLFVGDGGTNERKVMHATLWNYAVEHFQRKDYETSAEIFEKSMLYVSHDIESRLVRAKGFRVLCLCHLGLSQLDRAEEYINEAEKLEPNIAAAFLKFKIHLQKKNHNAAMEQIQAMPSCLDFTPDFLSLTAHEAVACHALPVAASSLSNLLNFYVSGKTMPQSEVVILRTLITILTQDPVNTPEVLKFLKLALSRASEVGHENFFGKGEVGRREVKWFAMISWNNGTDSGKNKDFESSAEFLRVANEFHGLLVEGEVDENNSMVCKSLILIVSAMIASENQKKVALVDAEVKQAAEQLDKAGKILKAFSMRMQLEDDQSATIAPEYYFIHTLTSYDIHGRINDSRSQLLIVKSFASSKEHKTMHLLQIGLSAAQGQRPNPEVALFALNYCLSELLSSVSPDYQNVALIIRNLVAVTSLYKGDTDDDAVYGMYKQAYRIMIGLKEGEYPLEEGKWLATTAWNRAAIPVRFGQIDVAKKWMKVGLELAGLIPGMETYRSCMEDFVKGLDKNFSPNRNGVGKPHLLV